MSALRSRKELGTSRKFQVGSQKEDQVDRINLTTDFADNADPVCCSTGEILTLKAESVSLTSL